MGSYTMFATEFNSGMRFFLVFPQSRVAWLRHLTDLRSQ